MKNIIYKYTFYNTTCYTCKDLLAENEKNVVSIKSDYNINKLRILFYVIPSVVAQLITIGINYI